MVAKPVVVAQLTVRSLPIPEDPGSNPVVGSSYYTFICCELFDENKTKIKQKMPGMVANLKKHSIHVSPLELSNLSAKEPHGSSHCTKTSHLADAPFYFISFL